MGDTLVRAGLLDPDDAAGFLRRGHFAYQSGHHGDVWLELDRLFAQPRRMRRAAEALAERLAAHGADLVCGPLVGGALVGQMVAAALDVRFVAAAAHPQPDGPVRYVVASSVRGLAAGAHAVVVDDVINAGSAVLACFRELQSLGATVVALGGLVLRASSVPAIEAFAALKLEGLAMVDWSMWPPASCPLCAAGAPLTPPE